MHETTTMNDIHLCSLSRHLLLFHRIIHLLQRYIPSLSLYARFWSTNPRYQSQVFCRASRMTSHVPGNNMDDNNGTTIKDIRQQKQELRKEMRSRLIKMSSEETLKQSRMVWDHLIRAPEYKTAQSIGLFLSMPKNEIDTYEIIKRSIEVDNKVVFVPRVGLDFEKCDMDLVKVQNSSDDIWTRWPRNKWNIPEPPIEYDCVATPGDIDILIVPGNCFDMKGSRLGQGKGYYDRFIEKMRSPCRIDAYGSQQKPLLVAVCLSPQLLPVDQYVPTSDHDFKMDMLITPETTFSFVSDI